MPLKKGEDLNQLDKILILHAIYRILGRKGNYFEIALIKLLKKANK
jgi:hypothetical protein